MGPWVVASGPVGGDGGERMGGGGWVESMGMEGMPTRRVKPTGSFGNRVG